MTKSIPPTRLATLPTRVARNPITIAACTWNPAKANSVPPTLSRMPNGNGTTIIMARMGTKMKK